jgi:hypothetical protein
MAADLVSRLKLEEVFKAAENGDLRTQKFGAALNNLTGVDLTKWKYH